MRSCVWSSSVVESPFGSGCIFVWWGWVVRARFDVFVYGSVVCVSKMVRVQVVWEGC